MAQQIPNRWTPMTRDEWLAQQYADQPHRLLDLAAATGNQALSVIAREMVVTRIEKRRRRR